MSIRILDDNTINKIAAGEVIENPSNIVKELVENAIDSGAKNIEINISDAGLSLIKVSDDGEGFDKDDIKLAFLKHATSKLTKLEDIYDIESYGFRGEALSSIAAVSRVRLISKKKNAKNGYSYYIEFGKGEDLNQEAANNGTVIIVEDLFENVPVRKKFLKSDIKETANIEDIIIKFAYIRPDISFKLIIDNVLKFNSNGDSNLKNIIYAIYGKDIYDSLLSVDDEIRGVKISGYIAHPKISKNNRNDIIYFVNNRYVKNQVIRKGIEDAYAEYMMQHKFPLTILKIDIDNKSVDVNVHPKKEEVRFSSDDAIYYVVFNIVSKTLKNTELIHNDALFYEGNDKKIQKDGFQKEENDINESVNIDNLPTLYDILKEKSSSGLNVNNLLDKLSEKRDNKIYEEKTFITKTLSDDHKYIGQIFDTYILVEYDEKLYIIDQHAAHEKINYENLMKAYKNDKISSQKIFPSIMLKLTPIQYAAVEKNIDDFKKLGYEIEIFGDNDIKVDAVPFNIVDIGKKDLLIQMIDEFTNELKSDRYTSIIDRIATMSCKNAIKAGRKLSEIEVKNLLRELFKLDNPYNCPHGRPTIISLSKSEFEKKFGRLV